MRLAVSAVLSLLGAVAWEVLLPADMCVLGPASVPGHAGDLPSAVFRGRFGGRRPSTLELGCWPGSPGVGASASMLTSSVPSSSLSYSSESRYSSAPLSSLVWGRYPLPTVAGSPVGVDMVTALPVGSSWEGESGCFFACPSILRTSSRDRVSGVPSELGPVSTTSLRRGCDRVACVSSPVKDVATTTIFRASLDVLGRGLLAHRPGDWETTCRVESLLAGAIRSRRMLTGSEEGEAATAAQLLGLDAVTPTIDGGIVLVALPCAH